MSAVILAVLDRPESSEIVLAAAAGLAELSAARRINALVIRTPPIATILPSEEVLTRAAEARIRAQEARRRDLIKAVFDEWRRGLHQSLSAEWFDTEAAVDAAVIEHGSRADAIALNRPPARESEPAQSAVRAALFACGRPVLIAPAEWNPGPLGRRIAVAWRDDPRTVKAVLSVLRWVGRAEHVDVLVGLRAGASAPRMPEIFEEHGVPATMHVLPVPGTGPFGAALLAKAAECGADMLAMGAFAHSGLRNLILGGVTSHMLAHAHLPILMRH